MSVRYDPRQYSHRQWLSKYIVFMMSVAYVVMLIIGSLETANRWPIPVVGTAVFVLAALVFGSLSVRVDSERLRLRFGIGLIRFSYPLGEIVSCRPVRNKWWYGLGIRLYPGGWLFNVAGLDAVEIVLKNGARRRVGTDEPLALCQALKSNGPDIEVADEDM